MVTPVNVDKRYGGMSDVRTLMSEEQFLYGENLDWQSDPECIQVAHAVKGTWTSWALTISTWNDLMLCACTDRDWITWDVFWFWESGEIYHDDGSAWVNVGTVNDWWARDIYNCARFDDKILMFYTVGTSLRIAEIDLVNVGTTTGSRNANITVNAYTGVWYTWGIDNFSGYCPYVIADRYLFVATGQTIGRLELWATTVVQSNIQFEDNVVWITRQWPLFRVYLANGKIYFRDWFAESAEAGIDSNLTVRCVRNFDKMDLFYENLFAREWALYQSSGYNVDLLKRAVYDEEIEKAKYQFDISGYRGNNIMHKNRNKYYMSAIVKDGWVDNAGIVSFGKDYDWFPMAYFVNATIDYNIKKIQEVWAIFASPASSQILQFSYLDEDSNGRIGYIYLWDDPTSQPPSVVNTYAFSWHFYTRKFDFWIKNAKKRITQAVIRADIPDANYSIDIEYALDGSTTYNTLTTISWPLDRTRLYPINLVDDFYEITFKFTFNNHLGVERIKLYDFTFEVEPVNG